MRRRDQAAKRQLKALNGTETKKAREASDDSGSGLPNHISNLMDALLIRIFANLPIGPRIRVMSLVSKQWRAAVYRSVMSWTITHEHKSMEGIKRGYIWDPSDVCKGLALCQRASGLLQHFHTLQELTLRACGATRIVARLPSSIRRLELVVPNMRGDSLQPAQDGGERFFRFEGPIPSLSHLTYRSGEWAIFESLLPLLSASVATLTALHLDGKGVLTEEVASFLAVTHFPALSNLYISTLRYESPKHKSSAATIAAATASAMTFRHASQLTELSLIGEVSDAISQLSFPRLLHFRIEQPGIITLNQHQDVQPQLAQLVANAPRLIDCAVVCKSFAHIPPILLPLVTALELCVGTCNPGESLQPCTRLRTLRVRLPDVGLSRGLLLPVLSHAATSLVVTEANAQWAISGELPNLMELGMPMRSPFDRVTVPLRLLRRLDLTDSMQLCMDTPFHDQLQQLCEMCPRLEELRLDFWTQNKNSVTAMKNFLVWLAKKPYMRVVNLRRGQGQPDKHMKQLIEEVRSETRGWLAVYWRDMYWERIS